MKRIAWILLAALLFALCACGTAAPPETNVETAAETTDSRPDVQTTVPAPTVPETTVAFPTEKDASTAPSTPDQASTTVSEPSPEPKEIMMQKLELKFDKEDLISSEDDPKTSKRGSVTRYALWYSTDDLDVSSYCALVYNLAVHRYLCSIAFFDAERQFLSGIGTRTVSRAASERGVAVVPEGAKYARFCNFISDDYSFEDASVFGIPTREDYEEYLRQNPRSGKKIALIGDSLTEGDQGTNTAGVGHLSYRNYPFYLGETLGCTTVNFGKCGYTAADILQCFKREIDVSDADVILVMLGTNAGLSDSDLQKAYKSVLTMINRNKKEGAQVVIVTPPHATEIRGKVNYGYNPNVISAAVFARSYAKKNGLPLIDAYRDSPVKEENENVYQPNDGLHLCPAGYQVFAQFIAEQLLLLGVL